MDIHRPVVLVEGESDRVALCALAARTGQDLRDVEIVSMGGVTNIRAVATRYGQQGLGRELAGLYDIGEEHHVRRGLVAAGLSGTAGDLRQLGFHACDVDLEDELIRGLGIDAAEAVIEDVGEGRSLRLLAQMPAQRHWTRGEVLRRFLGSQSGRKARYAEHFVMALDLGRAPIPLTAVLAEISPT